MKDLYIDNKFLNIRNFEVKFSYNESKNILYSIFFYLKYLLNNSKINKWIMMKRGQLKLFHYLFRGLVVFPFISKKS